MSIFILLLVCNLDHCSNIFSFLLEILFVKTRKGSARIVMYIDDRCVHKKVYGMGA